VDPRYLLRRAAYAAVVVVGVSLMVFGVMRLGGDPALLMVPIGAGAEEVSALRRSMGLDRPLPAQYAAFVLAALRGDLGQSHWMKRPALELVVERVPATLELAVAAMLLATVVAVPAGIASAVWRSSALDLLVRLGALLGQSMPVFWLGLMLILVFSVHLGWLPPFGREDRGSLVLPAVALATLPMARNARLVRAGMLDVLRREYVTTARAKGLAECSVLAKHALANGLLPVVTMMALEFGQLVGGSVIAETIFAWPGVGRLMIQAIYNRDFPVVQAGVLLVAVAFVAINFVTDLLYAWLDPRIRYA
jgi:ABC-type dipeptide/oligopeptide/nickel transport system permease component